MAKASTKTTKKRPVNKRSTTTTKRVTKKDADFFEFRATQETLYWVIFGVVAIIFALWIFSVDNRVQKIYDDVESSMHSTSEVVPAQPAESTEAEVQE